VEISLETQSSRESEVFHLDDDDAWCRILTNMRKHKMGIGSPVCIYCGDTNESILHIMRDCPLAMTVWIHVVPVHVRDRFFQ
jgi:hypothetical protein